MSDEPKQETSEQKPENALSKPKSLKLQPSAEFAAEQASSTGPQISLPSSPAAADPSPAPPPEEPVVLDPEYTPAPDPLALQMQAQAAPIEKSKPETPPAQPIVPEAFRAPGQAVATTKAHHTPPPQQFALTSEAAAAEKEANAMTSLLDGGVLVAGFAAMLVYAPGGYWIRNEWIIAGISTVLVTVSIVCAILRYRAKNNLGVVATIGLAAATFSILTLIQFIVIEVFLRNFGGSGPLF